MSNWVQLDPTRESWLFLIVGASHDTDTEDDLAAPVPPQTPVDYWEIGVGNKESLLESQAAQRDTDEYTSETELLSRLIEELDSYRHENVVLLTPSIEILRHLRRRLLRTQSSGTSLRGFRHIPVSDVVKDHFGVGLSRYDSGSMLTEPPRITETEPAETVSAGATSSFWELWVELFHLLPPNELVGEPL